ncbi:MAG: FKBP-type peptidyl-prolyl cis-trans isomerase [Candidatus Eremiobacteraeota bacterium]|nr:FKBP-type peptidyl-prolyl cis-trans isomerase [Candidatus Eremiobacteraeota bacterium]
MRPLVSAFALVAAMAAATNANANAASNVCSQLSGEFKAGPSPSVSTGTGLRYVLQRAGGKKAVTGQVAIMQYTLCLPGAKKPVDASSKASPFAFTLGAKQVIRGMEEAVRLLGVGGSMDILVPYALGYGVKGSPPVIPSKSPLLFRIELSDIKTAALSTLLQRSYDAGGTLALQRTYDQLAHGGFKNLAAGESDLNLLGYRLIKKHHVDAAIVVLAINAQRFPKSWNVYDSLGDAYRIKGDRELASSNYRRALALNPKDTNAVQMLQALEHAGSPSPSPAVSASAGPGRV